ncbi:hypothetical protein FACS1894217_14420 [Clostridia bacterium]|nr:hypothetical protein FACS1894217_14420 [Clostridia bacterium]
MDFIPTRTLSRSPKDILEAGKNEIRRRGIEATARMRAISASNELSDDDIDREIRAYRAGE